jgi:uncharacterized repeat protein (TIGR03803 family)
VFRVNSGGRETVLYTFDGTSTGGFPFAGVIRDSAGNLYGTTASGGDFGLGTVFKLDSNRQETLLYSFTGGADGSEPASGPLVQDTEGDLYGTTGSGGDLSSCPPFGCGVVFKLDATGKETVLHTFGGGTDGAAPSGLVLDPSGSFYGTTSRGGDLACNSGGGCGTVFKVDRSGSYSVLHSFTGSPNDGNAPASLVEDAEGNLYGVTEGGGKFDRGAVFKLDTKGSEELLHSFPHPGIPTSLILDKAGDLYGTTEYGEAQWGTVFELSFP